MEQTDVPTMTQDCAEVLCGLVRTHRRRDWHSFTFAAHRGGFAILRYTNKAGVDGYYHIGSSGDVLLHEEAS